MIKRDKMSI